MTLFNNIAEQRPQDVALLFQKYGLSKVPVNGKSLAMATIKNKKPFIDDLYEIVYGSYSNADGDEPQKKNFLGKINEGLEVITGVKNIFSKKDEPKEVVPADDKKPAKTILGINRSLFIVICILIVMLVALFFLPKKKLAKG